jgi:pre-mRNA-splicing factor SYF1
MFRRYMKLCPEDAEEFIAYLMKSDRLDEAAIKLGDIVNDEKFTSKESKSKHQLWHDLCDLMTKNPDKVS